MRGHDGERGSDGRFVAKGVDRKRWTTAICVEALDQLAAGLVADRARTESQFKARLRRNGDAILARGAKALQGGSAAKAVMHDVAFHSFIYEMSGNPLIAPTAEAHWLFLRRVMIGVLLHAERGTLNALVAGDAEGGVDLATRHVVGAKQALMDAMDKGGADHLFSLTTEPEPKTGPSDKRRQARR